MTIALVPSGVILIFCLHTSFDGAGYGNRTRVSSLGSLHTTIVLIPRLENRLLFIVAAQGIIEMDAMTRFSTRAFFILILFLLSPQITQAESPEVVVSTQFDAQTIVKGFTLESSDQRMRLGIRPGTLNVATRVDVKTLDDSLMEETLPKDKQLIGNVYLFDILNKSSYDGKDFFFLEIKYPEESDTDSKLHGRRRIYFYNKPKLQWEELPSVDNAETQSVRSLIHLPYARLAIFEETIPEIGKASWYGYKNCDCAASPDYPKGTLLVVTRADDPTRTVTVKVNDYGPDRSVHPERVIDLDKVAFQKLGSLGAGILDVRVQLLQ